MMCMKILTAAEMQACDRATSEQFGVPSIDLMRAASKAVADFVRSYFSRARRITILCGHGNNGGDGLMTARLLLESGLDVTVLLLAIPKPCTATQPRPFVNWTPFASHLIRVVSNADQLNDLASLLDADLILDALVGTGFKPPLRDLPLAALEWLKASNTKLRSSPSTCPRAGMPTPPPRNQPVRSFPPSFPPTPSSLSPRPKPAHLFGQAHPAPR